MHTVNRLHVNINHGIHAGAFIDSEMAVNAIWKIRKTILLRGDMWNMFIHCLQSNNLFIRSHHAHVNRIHFYFIDKEENIHWMCEKRAFFKWKLAAHHINGMFFWCSLPRNWNIKRLCSLCFASLQNFDFVFRFALTWTFLCRRSTFDLHEILVIHRAATKKKHYIFSFICAIVRATSDMTSALRIPRECFFSLSFRSSSPSAHFAILLRILIFSIHLYMSLTAIECHRAK